MLVFEERGKLGYPEKNLLEQGREPTTNLTHIWHQTWELNLGHIGGSGVLSPLHHHGSTFLYWPTLKFSSLFRNFRQRIYLNSFSSKQYAIREKEIEKEFSSLYAKIIMTTCLVGTFHCFSPKCRRAARSGDKILVQFSSSHGQILKLSKEAKREWLWSLRWISCFKYAHTWSSLVAILQNIVQALLGNRGKD